MRTAFVDYEAKPDRATYSRFTAKTEAPRQELARRLNQVPGATA